MSNSSSNRVRSSRGNALVEFALTFLVIWSCFTGVCQFGFAMLQYQRLEQVLCEGARYASTTSFDLGGAAFSSRVRNMIVYGTATAGTTPLVPGLTTAKVRVMWTADAGGYPKTITVGIQNFSSVTGFRTFTWNGKPSLTVR